MQILLSSQQISCKTQLLNKIILNFLFPPCFHFIKIFAYELDRINQKTYLHILLQTNNIRFIHLILITIFAYFKCLYEFGMIKKEIQSIAHIINIQPLLQCLNNSRVKGILFIIIGMICQFLKQQIYYLLHSKLIAQYLFLNINSSINQIAFYYQIKLFATYYLFHLHFNYISFTFQYKKYIIQTGFFYLCKFILGHHHIFLINSIQQI
ncbi:hypothetical protein ABPG74_016717 [Tetrahymena malaccensis]